MNVYQFLQALPALIGFVGFFVYLWVGQKKISGEIFIKIIDRLRNNPNIDLQEYKNITPVKLQHLIAADERIKSLINHQDQELLHKIIKNQSLTTIIVFIICAILVAFGVWLVRTDPWRPKPVYISEIKIEATEKKAGGLLVDLDPILVSWRADGDEETIKVLLENINSGHKTTRKSVTSSARLIQFESADLLPVLDDRSYKSSNRVRAIIETSQNTFHSQDINLFVGIRVSLFIGAKLITKKGDATRVNQLVATIDDSTEKMPQNYCFSGEFAAYDNSHNSIVQALRSCNYDSRITLSKLSTIDWNLPHGFIYYSPDDPRIVRSFIEGYPVNAN